MYRTLFYVNMYGTYKLSKTVRFLAHSVVKGFVVVPSKLYVNTDGNKAISLEKLRRAYCEGSLELVHHEIY